MSELDQLFRDGLGNRKPEVPADLWKKIKANKAAVPEADALDQLFASTLANRQAAVPEGMWARIVGARKPVTYLRYVAALLLLLSLGAGYLVYDYASAPAHPSGRGAQVQREFPKADLADSPTPREPAATLQEGTSVSAPVAAPRAAAAGGPSAQPEQPNALGLADAVAPNASTTLVKSPLLAAAGLITTLPPADLLLKGLLPAPGPVHTTSEGGFRASGRRRFQGEVLLGAAYAHQRFGLQQEGAWAQRDLREVSEFPEVSYQLSARLRYRLAGQWRLITGLTYVELRNQFEYESPLSSSNRLLRSNNRLRLMEVPLLASYELPGRRLRVSINAGPLLHYTAGVSGRYLDPASAQPRELKQNGQYRRELGLGWTTSLTTTYTLGKQQTIQLLLEPFFKQYPGSFTTPDAPLAERYWMGGLQVGLRKQLR